MHDQIAQAVRPHVDALVKEIVAIVVAHSDQSVRHATAAAVTVIAENVCRGLMNNLPPLAVSAASLATSAPVAPTPTAAVMAAPAVAPLIATTVPTVPTPVNGVHQSTAQSMTAQSMAHMLEPIGGKLMPVYTPSKRRWHCPYCKSFDAKTRRGVSMHMLHCEQAKTPWECGKCSARFMRKRGRDGHMRWCGEDAEAISLRKCMKQGCRAPSKGPRFSYLCNAHKDASAADIVKWRKQWKASRDNAAQRLMAPPPVATPTVPANVTATAPGAPSSATPSADSPPQATSQSQSA